MTTIERQILNNQITILNSLNFLGSEFGGSKGRAKRTQKIIQTQKLLENDKT